MLGLTTIRKDRIRVYLPAILSLSALFSTLIYLQPTPHPSLLSLPSELTAQTNDLNLEILRSPRFKHPVMILQHFSLPTTLHPDYPGGFEGILRADRLAKYSKINHERYAKTYGYVYEYDETQYVPIKEDRTITRNEKSFNKIWMLLRVMLEEMKRPEDERVEWIMLVSSSYLLYSILFHLKE